MPFTISAQQRDAMYRRGQFLITDVSSETIGALGAWILQHRPAIDKFTIVINSSGGSPTAVLRFASWLGTLSKGVKITGVAFDECGSAALALLQCCDERIALRYTCFFMHHVQTTVKLNCQKPDMTALRREVTQSRLLEEQLVSLQCRRTGISRARWFVLANEGEARSRAIHADRALKLGLVDKIVDRYEIF